MKRVFKWIGKILLILLLVILIFISATTIYHHVALGTEAKSIVPNGQLVEVNGHNIHVYAEGQKGDKPTLVFLSGSGTVAPVYDFKALYSLLSGDYRIAVVEKLGYGYSDIAQAPRDSDTLLHEVREALSLAGEAPPYVLMPHSMSGLEAVYWAQQYPDEVAAIIGLDMSVPEGYDSFDAAGTKLMMNLGRASVWLGLHRIPGVYGLDTISLTPQEIEQQKLLMYRNAVNPVYLTEVDYVVGNAMTVKAGGKLALPLLMFVSNGEIGDYWIPAQEHFASENGGQLVMLDCGHYVHHFEYERIAEETLVFLENLT